MFEPHVRARELFYNQKAERVSFIHLRILLSTLLCAGYYSRHWRYNKTYS